MATILHEIVRTKRREVAEAMARRPPALVRAAAAAAGPPRDFYAAATHPGLRVRLIAEIKRKSPSAGLIRPTFDPVAIAHAYADNGADALSVLTDEPYFDGRLEHIATVKTAVGLPVLRKDFMLDAYQVFEARAAGADAVLLIAEILDAGDLARLAVVAGDLGMTTLIEVHDERQCRDLQPLLSAERRVLLGINNRDLVTQTTDVGTAARLARLLEPGTQFVAESGMTTAADVRRMAEAGAAAVLIGETFMRARDIGAKVRELMAASRS